MRKKDIRLGKVIDEIMRDKLETVEDRVFFHPDVQNVYKEITEFVLGIDKISVKKFNKKMDGFMNKLWQTYQECMSEGELKEINDVIKDFSKEERRALKAYHNTPEFWTDAIPNKIKEDEDL